MNIFDTPVNKPEARYILPQLEERTPQGTKTMDPYTRLYQDRIIFLATQVDDTSASDIVAQLLALSSQDKNAEITIYINSPGGSISAMSMIIDTIRYIEAPVTTVCLGLAASAAAVLLAAGDKGRRFALPHSSIMIHQPRNEGSMRGQASDIEIYADEVKRTRIWLEEFLASRTGQDVEKLREDTERDFWMTAEKALEYGIIDGIIQPNKE